MPKYTERSAGIYRCTYTGCKDVTFDDKDNPGQEVTRWAWGFQELADPTSAGFIDQLTGTSLKSPNSNAYKIASGLMGRKLQPDDDTETKVGQTYDVVYGPNQAGNLAITAVMPVTAATSPAPVGEAAGTGGTEVAATSTVPDELPF